MPFRTNKDGYTEWYPKEEEEKKEPFIEKATEKHYYHYIPYPVYVRDYPWYPYPYFPQSPYYKPIWTVTPESYTWSTTTRGTNGTINIIN